MNRLLLLLILVACGSTPPPAPIAKQPPPPVAIIPVDAAAPDAPPPAPVEPKDIDSKDILARTPGTASVEVKHVLIAWKDLAASYRGKLDPRAAQRTNDEAVVLAIDVLTKLAKDPSQIDTLVHEHSEDPGSLTDQAYVVGPDTAFVPEFKALALRLHENEAGIVRTMFGYHVMLRIPPDPLTEKAILARKPTEGTVEVQIIVLGWTGTQRSTATRTKADADQLAVATLKRVKKGEPMAKLMAELSEDPGSKDTGKPYDVTADAPMEENFKLIAMRLKVGEAGLAKTAFGWMVIKRVPPPPPDALESAAILKRKPVTEKSKVKHILLGWTEAHADDERGKARTRPELEKLVKDTLKRLKTEPIDALMAELSEDPGSAKDGRSYDVTTDATFVAPFRDLSLRLKVDEVGVVKTVYGIHIIKRIE